MNRVRVMGRFARRLSLAAVVPGKSPEYPVGRPLGLCHVTGAAIEPGQPYVASLRETPDGFERLEFSAGAWADWPAEEKARLLAFWRTTMPSREALERGKRKLLVDDEILAELFRRLADVNDDAAAAPPEKLAFRFMLGLILMRKKKLVYEGTETDAAAGRDVWRMRFRKEEEVHDLIDPKLDESQLEEVGRQVGQILSGGLDEDALAAGGGGEGA